MVKFKFTLDILDVKYVDVSGVMVPNYLIKFDYKCKHGCAWVDPVTLANIYFTFQSKS